MEAVRGAHSYEGVVDTFVQLYCVSAAGLIANVCWTRNFLQERAHATVEVLNVDDGAHAGRW